MTITFAMKILLALLVAHNMLLTHYFNLLHDEVKKLKRGNNA